MSEVWKSDMLIIFLKAASKVSVILAARPQKKNIDTSKVNAKVFFLTIFCTKFVRKDFDVSLSAATLPVKAGAIYCDQIELDHRSGRGVTRSGISG